MIGLTPFSRKQFFDYAVKPGLIPRANSLFFSGFQYIPFFIALVYQAVRLLPPGHPYANPANMGRFGLRHVIAEAANNLVLRARNIDQILLFVTILAGLVIAAIQICLVGVSLFFQPVLAAGMPASFSGFFTIANENRPHDLANIMMDLVFGIPDMFNSCVSIGAGCIDTRGQPILGYTQDGSDATGWIMSGLGWPFPIHEALHQMLQTYSIGLLIIAVIVTIYFIITILAETAQTGTAFGKRFNKVWAPIRIVAAFGLLVPLSHGLNGSQYAVLYAAKFGSAFATNGWALFNDQLSNNYLGGVHDLVGQPNKPEVGGLLQFLYTARVCKELERVKNGRAVEPYLIRGPFYPDGSVRLLSFGNSGATVTYEEMINFIDGDDKVLIRFGVREHADGDDPADYAGGPLYAKYKAFTEPTCGDLVLPLKDPRVPGSDNPPEPGTLLLQRYYWYIVHEIWFDVLPGNFDFALMLDDQYQDVPNADYPLNTVKRFTQWDPDPAAPLPPTDYKNAMQLFYSQDLEAIMVDPASTGLNQVVPGAGSVGALELQANSGLWAVDPLLKQKGWAGAGIWYNKVAELNGAITAAVLNIPYPQAYPMVMEFVAARKRQQDQDVNPETRFEPKLANGDDIWPAQAADSQMATAMWIAFNFWQQGGGVTTTHTNPTGNALIDSINAILGTEGLYSMRKNTDVHPLAQLVGVGRSLVESSIRNMGNATQIALGGALFTHLGKAAAVGQAASVIVNLMMTVTMISLTAGFVLFYVVPFMPFIYFFFAVGGWIKGIFEAMVGAPLWALAHIRIDGNGLPGSAAASGYYLVLEIFLRPILIIFGLLGSISIFSAMVMVLNQTWDLVASNLAGFDIAYEMEGEGADFVPKIDYFRGPIDEFFFTVIYTIIVYLIAMSSFKMIDLVPNNIMRWMGASIKSFNDEQENPAQNLSAKVGVGGQQAISAVGGGYKGVLEGLSVGSGKKVAGAVEGIKGQ